jgi:flagellar L-ring protein precursor FlgH
MKHVFKVMSIIVIVLLTAQIPVWSQNTYSAQSLFTDHRAYKVGDIITILIVEYSSAKSEANSSNKRTNNKGLTMTGGARTQSYMPLFGINGQTKNNFDNDAETSRKGSLTGKITASITDVTGNGNFIIKGEREVIVNGEKERMTVSGIIRPQDINRDNTILSVIIGDAKISYQGKGIVDKGQKPGFFSRFLGWFF